MIINIVTKKEAPKRKEETKEEHYIRYIGEESAAMAALVEKTNGILSPDDIIRMCSHLKIITYSLELLCSRRFDKTPDELCFTKY